MGGRQTDSVMSDYVRERLDRVVAELRPSGRGATPEADRGTRLRRPPDPEPPEPEPFAAPPRPAPIRRTPKLEFTRRHLLVVAVVLLLGALAGGYALTRSRAVPVGEPLPVQQAGGSAPAPVPAPPASPTPEATPSPAVVRVHVTGEVRRPGVHTLPLGSRVVDAIEAAGGLTPAARPGELNLAQQLTDGQQVLIGGGSRPGGEVRGGAAPAAPGGSPAPGGGAGGAGAGAAGAGGKVNLNTATEAQLDALPGVGPVTAQKILAWRTQNGRFSRIEELQEVPGIGPKSFADIAPLVTV
ncbi:ComEA family DNA-binding protein [Enemella evansiae]|uniref:ComEA family DNA-binding protein n=1 Tax=Enemella evansiae TaxID=2016499 RepID=UPI001E34E6B4|nr:ComEA family DNA-binding protein [Enemella evansiae]